MPKIRFYENDNTGFYDAEESVGVFVVGKVGVKSGVELDANNCVYITYQQDISDFFDVDSVSTSGSSDNIKTLILIQQYIAWGYDVLYFYLGTNAVEDVDYGFLQDKDSYNVKYLTAGVYGTLTATKAGGFTDNCLVKLAEQASERHDCVVLADLKYDVGGDYYYNEGDLLANDLYGWLNEEDTDGKRNLETENLGWASLFFPNGVIAKTTLGSTTVKNITVPAYYYYLNDYAKVMNGTEAWNSIAGVARGTVADYTPDLSVTKFNFDNNIILDDGGICFNGLVPTLTFGEIIWGDRTLYDNGKSLKASSYLSLRSLVCDVVKQCHKSAVRYTYETNNNVTWTNFKTEVVELLDKMVSAQVMSTYKVRKIALNNEGNKLACRLTLYPIMPLENFDITINLENAEVTFDDEDEEEE